MAIVFYSSGMYIAVLGDCTGHGVPGAVLVSMGIAFLYQIIDSHDCELMPDTILTQLREKVISSFGVDTFSTTRATVPKPTTSP